MTLRSYISYLRQALGGKDALGAALATRSQGYCLDVPPHSVDAVRLTSLTEAGREHLRRGEPEQALTALDEAVRSWSGDPLAEVSDHEVTQSTITQLTETYLDAAEAGSRRCWRLGRHRDAVPALEAFAADHPLREEPRALLMLALHRSGRAPDALDVHRRFRTLLQEELGIDPSPRLDELTRGILEQDPGLAAPPVTTRPVPEPPETSAHGR